jgi:hypothetical protein
VSGSQDSVSGRSNAGNTCGALEALAFAPRPQERFLYQVFGLLERADHPVAVHLQLPPILLDQLAEGRLVSVPGGSDGYGFTGPADSISFGFSELPLRAAATHAVAPAPAGWGDGIGEVAVQGCLGDAGLGRDLAEGVALGPERPSMFDLVGGVGDRPANVSAARFGDGAGVSGALGGKGPFHLGEQREQQESDAAHALVGGVDGERIGQRANTDAALGQLVHEVQNLTEVTADPVQSMYNDRVAGTRVGQEPIEAVSVDGGSGSPVDEDPLVRDAGGGQGVELPIERLFGGGDAGVAEFKSPLWVIITSFHSEIVPKVDSVQTFWNSCCGTNSGTSGVRRCPILTGWATYGRGRSASKEVERSASLACSSRAGLADQRKRFDEAYPNEKTREAALRSPLSGSFRSNARQPPSRRQAKPALAELINQCAHQETDPDRHLTAWETPETLALLAGVFTSVVEQ